MHVGREAQLAFEVVTDHPFTPENLKGIHIEARLLEPLRLLWDRSRWRRVEGDPSDSFDPGFDPTMCVRRAQNQPAIHRIHNARLETGDHARGDATSAQHHRHSRGEVLAVALAAFKQEVRKHVRHGLGR